MRDKAVSKYAFQNFHSEMLKEYDRHYPDKGNSWMTCDVKLLKDVLIDHMMDWVENENRPDHLIDVANLCDFVWYRLTNDSLSEKIDKGGDE